MKIKAVDFANKYQIARESVYRLAKTGGLLMTKGMIDDSLPSNRIWIEKRTMHLEQEQEPTQDVNPEAQTDANPTSLTALKALNLRLDAEFKTLRNDEKAGKLVPVDLMKVVISQYIEQFKMSIMNSTDLLIRDTLNELQAPNILITRSCSTLVDLINEATKTAYDNVTKEIDTIIENQNL